MLGMACMEAPSGGGRGCCGDKMATCLMVRMDGWMSPQGLQASDVGGMAASDDRERGPFFPHLGVMGWGCLPIC